MKPDHVVSPPHLLNPLSHLLFRRILWVVAKMAPSTAVSSAPLVMSISAGSKCLGQCLFPSDLNQVLMGREGFLPRWLSTPEVIALATGMGKG